MIYPLANLFGIENWMIILAVALLLFGKRMPEVGRSLGQGIVEFKRGLQGLKDDVNEAGITSVVPTQPQPARQLPANPQTAAANAGYKFDPYTGKPLRVDPVTGQEMRFDPFTGKPLTDTVTVDQVNEAEKQSV